MCKDSWKVAMYDLNKLKEIAMKAAFNTGVFSFRRKIQRKENL